MSIRCSIKKFLAVNSLLAMVIICFGQTPVTDKKPVDYVNTVIGTSSKGFAAGLEGGGTMPCVNTPFAMTNFVAQTNENKMGRAAYDYEEHTIIGFLASHQPAVWMGDYGYVSIMPQIGNLKVLPKDRSMVFDHKDEIAKPYYYRTKLKNDQNKTILAEMTAGSKSGIMRFTFSEADSIRIIVQGINLNADLQDWANDIKSKTNELKGFIHIDVKRNEITGYNPDRQSSQIGPLLKNFKGYFLIKFDRQINSFGTWDQSVLKPGSTEIYGSRSGAYLNFKGRKQLQVKVATSFISLDQARINLQEEIPGWDFEKRISLTKAAWEKELNVIELAGVNEEQKSIFYTAMYHCLLFPRSFTESGRYYSAADDRVHAGVSYTDYSLWDTFRALHPLLTIIQPSKVNGMVQSLVQMYEQSGWLPMWPNPAETNIMIGTHADAVIADAFVKGFRGFDIKKAYQAVRKDAFMAPDGDEGKRWGDRDRWTSFEARGGVSYYRKLGFIPADKVNESVSRAIEYSFDDWCIAQMAKGLGHNDDYAQLMKWSKDYKNQFNHATGFMAPKNSDGNWSKNANEGFTEGTNWTYTFGAMHDVNGMIELMGGKNNFTAKLDENFNNGHYRADNEPGHHYIYLYDYVGKSQRTQELVRKHTSAENFRNNAIGINGNDDCGQTSAWYIFGVMGFYPLSPASGSYVIGAPQYPEIKINVKGGKVFIIKANHISDKNLYIRSVKLNGKTLKHFEIKHTEIMQGGLLEFEMSATPYPTF